MNTNQQHEFGRVSISDYLVALFFYTEREAFRARRTVVLFFEAGAAACIAALPERGCEILVAQYLHTNCACRATVLGARATVSLVFEGSAACGCRHDLFLGEG